MATASLAVDVINTKVGRRFLAPESGHRFQAAQAQQVVVEEDDVEFDLARRPT